MSKLEPIDNFGTSVRELEALLEARRAPAVAQGAVLGGNVGMQAQQSILYEEDLKRRAEEKHLKWANRTLLDELNEKIERLRTQHNSACELRELVVKTGIAGIKLELMRELIY